MKKTKVMAVLLSMVMMLSLGGFLASCAEEGGGEAGAFKIIIPDWSSVYDGREGENAMVYSAIQEKYKADTGNDLAIDLTYYPGVSYTQQVNMVVADEKSDIDAFTMYAGGFLNYASQPGLLMDLTDLIDEYGKNLKEKIPEQYWQAVTYDGKIMGIPDCAAAANDTAFIRMDILKENGIEKVPETIEELEAAFEIFKSEGMIPFRAPYFQMQKWLSGAYGLPYTDYLDENGKYVRVESHPNFDEYIATIQRWRIKGYLSTDYDTVTWQQNQLDFQAGKQGMCIGWYSFAETAYPILSQIVPNAEIEHLNVVNGLGTGHEDEIGYAPSTVINNAVHVFSNSKNAQAIVQYFDWLISDVENYMLASTGIDGTHYDYDKENNTLKTKPKYSDPAVKGYNGLYIMGFNYQVFGEYSNPQRIYDKELAQKAADLTGKAREELDSLKIIWSATQDKGIYIEDADVNAQLQSHTYNMNVIFSDYIINKSDMTGFTEAIAQEVAAAKETAIDKVGKDVYTCIQELFDSKS